MKKYIVSILVASVFLVGAPFALPQASAADISIRDFVNLLVATGVIAPEKMPAVNAFLLTLDNSTASAPTAVSILTPEIAPTPIPLTAIFPACGPAKDTCASGTLVPGNSVNYGNSGNSCYNGVNVWQWKCNGKDALTRTVPKICRIFTAPRSATCAAQDVANSDSVTTVPNTYNLPPVAPTAPTCDLFVYSSWSACSANGTQTRTVTASAPNSCVGGSPILIQKCTPAVVNLAPHVEVAPIYVPPTAVTPICGRSKDTCSSGNVVSGKSVTYGNSGNTCYSGVSAWQWSCVGNDALTNKVIKTCRMFNAPRSATCAAQDVANNASITTVPGTI